MATTRIRSSHTAAVATPPMKGGIVFRIIAITPDPATASFLGKVADTFGTSVDIKSVFVVGGQARAMVTGTSTQDIDIVFENRDAERGAELLASRYGVKVATFGFPTPRAYQVRAEKDGVVYEVESINMDKDKDSIDEDMGRRDFTCNAFAIPFTDAQRAMATGLLDTSRIVDPFGGVNDARNGILRAVSQGAMIDDPSRIFRWVRFLSVLAGFTSDEDTKKIVSDPANWERITKNCNADSRWTQMDKIYKSSNAARALQLLNEIGLVDIAYPGLVEFDRAMKAARWVDICSATTSDWMGESERQAWGQSCEFASLTSDQMFIVRLAALALGFDSPLERLTQMRVPSAVAKRAAKIAQHFSAAESDNAWEIHDAVGAENVEMACWFAMTQSFSRGETPRFNQLNAAICWQEPALPNGGEIALTCNLSGEQIGTMINRLQWAVRTGSVAEDHESVLAYARANADEVRASAPSRR